MKIAKKITLLTTLLIVMTGLVSSLVVYSYVSKKMETEAMEDMSRMSERLFDMVNDFLYDCIGDIKVFASSHAVISEENSNAEITARLLQYRDFYKTYDSLAVFDLNRVRLADTTGVNIDRQYSLNEYWLDPTVAKDVVIHPAWSETAGSNVMYFSYPVRNAQGKVFRIMVSRVPISRFGDILKMHSKDLFERNVSIDLLDQDGNLLYSSDEPQKILKEKTCHWKYIEPFIKGKADSGFFTTNDEKGKDLVFILRQPDYLDHKGEGWFLVVHIPLKVIDVPVIALRNYMAVIAVIFALAALILALLISRTISRPIIKLRVAAAEIGAGNFNAEIDTSSKDEVGELGAAFGQMAQDLKRAREGLEVYNRTLKSEVESRTVTLAKKLAELEETKTVMLSILDDVSESKRRLEELQAQLIQAGKLAGIGQMAAGIAHEINNPLTAILGFSQLVAARKDIDEVLRGDLARIEVEARRCTNIIGHLLSFARPQAMQLTKVDVNGVVEEATKIIEYSVKMEGIEIVRKFDPKLPRITGDPQQLQQVFMNLIINGANAMTKGGTLTIETSSCHAEHVILSGAKNPVNAARERTGSFAGAQDDKKIRSGSLAPLRMTNADDRRFVEISVADTGIGISDEDKDKLFEPFFTTSYKRGFKGTGLGLSISRSIIIAHNGRIEFESVVGKGTTFRVLLPVG